MYKKLIFMMKCTWRKMIFVPCILCCCSVVFAQVKVSGKIVDVDGLSVAGVSVSEKGTTNGVVTDSDGNYNISVQSSAAVLQISCLGYATQEITVGNRTAVDVTLLDETQALDEVVIVGYGTQKKVTLTGSVATLKAEELSSVPASNLSNALGGRLSGVYISGGMGGRPGNSSAIVIRSKGTWNNTDPLYVIDGVVRDKFAF
ncbi:MAG: carboxypeptidase-like regulatory domain-containing protein, partial [Prevotellaceae bacterium]|nr:carboxypeptidase-like regulatory domain-containing protein [Prevotellaceae bacterium]